MFCDALLDLHSGAAFSSVFAHKCDFLYFAADVMASRVSCLRARFPVGQPCFGTISSFEAIRSGCALALALVTLLEPALPLGVGSRMVQKVGDKKVHSVGRFS